MIRIGAPKELPNPIGLNSRINHHSNKTCGAIDGIQKSGFGVGYPIPLMIHFGSLIAIRSINIHIRTNNIQY